MSLLPFDYVKNINNKDGEIPSDEVLASYLPFVVNKAFSNTFDTVLFANTLNMLNNTDKVMQYHFLYHGIDKKKSRFGKWNKTEQDENITVIMEYYGYSYQKAKDVLSILVGEIDNLKQDLIKGGKHGKYETN